MTDVMLIFLPVETVSKLFRSQHNLELDNPNSCLLGPRWVWPIVPICSLRFRWTWKGNIPVSLSVWFHARFCPRSYSWRKAGENLTVTCLLRTENWAGPLLVMRYQMKNYHRMPKPLWSTKSQVLLWGLLMEEWRVGFSVFDSEGLLSIASCFP